MAMQRKNRLRMALLAAAAEPTFRFLDLCAELRNNIYEKVCEETSAHLSPRGKGHLTGDSSLGRVSRQFRKEFLPIFYLCSPTITVEIYDFDYRHVVSFLNRLGEHELHALCVKPERSMIFEMHVDHVPTSLWPPQGYTMRLGLGDAAKLEAWLKRLEHPTKKGTQLKILHEMYGRVQDMDWWLQALEVMEGRFDGDRAQLELKDMGLALEWAIQHYSTR